MHCSALASRRLPVLLILLVLLLLILVGASLLACSMVRRRGKGEWPPAPCAPCPGAGGGATEQMPSDCGSG